MFEKIINTLFLYLDKENISYCVLRNYELLPKENIGNDIDIQIDGKAITKFQSILSKLCDELNIKIIKKSKRYVLYNYVLIYEDLQVLQLDVHYRGEEYRGVSYLTNKQLLLARKKFRNFFIPCDEHEAIISLFSSLLYGGFIKEKYKLKIKKTFENKEPEVKAIIRGYMGEMLANEIVDLIINEQFETVERNVKNYRKSILLKGLRKNTLSLIRNNVKYLFGEYIYRFWNSGLFLVLLGCDGAGKSTIINELNEDLKEIFDENHSYIQHWRPHIIRQIRDIGKKEIENESGPVIDPHALKPYNFIISSLRLIYYSIDYIIYKKKILKSKAKNGVIIFDRYYYDMYIDPIRYRMKNHVIFCKILQVVIPKPDLIIYLDSTAEELVRRKGEMSEVEYNNLLDRYRKFTNIQKNSFTINTNEGILQTKNECFNIILDFLNRRDIKFGREK